MNSDKLPLKKVLITDKDFFRPGGGGGGKKVFGDVTPAVRNRVASEVRSVESHFQDEFRKHPKVAAVARVVLKEEAIAKSHRPGPLFERVNCPIIGVDSFGELLVSVRASTLPRLASSVVSKTSKEATANISTIQEIVPFVLDASRLTSLKEELVRKADMAVKLRLFRHRDASINSSLEEDLHKELQRLRIEYDRPKYARSIAMYRLRGVRPEHVDTLARFVGTQSLGAFPEYHVVRPAAQPLGKLTEAQFPPPEPGVDYPVVGIIDTGVDPGNRFLRPWLVGQESFVHVTDRDYEHGTFVAGLLVHARALNHSDPRFPDSHCRVLDVIALPRGGRISEDELLAILWEVVPKHPQVRVWNLSVASDESCSDHTFSEFAVALDEIQTQFGVTFVIAAGNYSVKPFRSWPPDKTVGEADRICAPADSVRALTVGSVAHRESAAARVRAPEPSPFSRRGPGPVYLPKPEVAHYGGNCDAHGGHAQIGVLSIDASGRLAESIGTSFAAPIAASVLAHVRTQASQEMSNLLAKALMIHSAVLTNTEATSDDVRYRGYGVPGNVRDILGCESWRATLLFEMKLRAGRDLQKTPFPIPACLRLEDQSFRGDITVTLVYAPPLDATFGAEYCRTNVDVSLGTYKPGKDGKIGQAGKLHQFPQDPTLGLSESTLIEHGFKWSPVKVYRRTTPRGVDGEIWRLRVDATDRSNAANAEVDVAMVVTIADIDRRAPVYNDVVRAMNINGWSTIDVSLRGLPRARLT